MPFTQQKNLHIRCRFVNFVEYSGLTSLKIVMLIAGFGVLF